MAPAAKSSRAAKATAAMKNKTKAPPRKKRSIVDLTQAEGIASDTENIVTTKRVRTSASQKAKSQATSSEKVSVVKEEKRLRRFRPQPTQNFLVILERALTQRMFVLDRVRQSTRSPTDSVQMFSEMRITAPSETITIAGTTGNLYTVVINELPSCSCPHAAKGNQCKHVVYVMNRVLKAPPHLQYQLALLSSELEEIFAHAPPPPQSSTADTQDSESAAKQHDSQNGNRKAIEPGDDCPICCTEFETSGENIMESIIYCRAACGNNMHKSCFDQWAALKRNAGARVTCPFCRCEWQSDPAEDAKALKTIMKNAKEDNEKKGSYVNVAAQLGISQARDYSTYHRPWVAQQRRLGLLEDEGDDYDDDY